MFTDGTKTWAIRLPRNWWILISVDLSIAVIGFVVVACLSCKDYLFLQQFAWVVTKTIYFTMLTKSRKEIIADQNKWLAGGWKWLP